MLSDHVEDAARLLCAARGGAPVHELPPTCRPQSDADAYQIQDAIVRQLGEPIGGWKVGAASANSAAFCAPIWMKMVRPSPAAYDAGELRLIGVVSCRARANHFHPDRGAAQSRRAASSQCSLSI